MTGKPSYLSTASGPSEFGGCRQGTTPSTCSLVLTWQKAGSSLCPGSHAESDRCTRKSHGCGRDQPAPHTGDTGDSHLYLAPPASIPPGPLCFLTTCCPPCGILTNPSTSRCFSELTPPWTSAPTLSQGLGSFCHLPCQFTHGKFQVLISSFLSIFHP